MNTMVCPKCKEEIDIPSAIMHKMLEEELTKAKLENREEFEKQKKDIEEKAEKRIEVINNYNLLTTDIAIGIIGRLTSIKNHNLFFEALKIIGRSSSKT